MEFSQLPNTGRRFYTTWRFMRDPYRCYRQWREQYGDTFIVNALNGNVVATCNRENIRRLFAARTESIAQFAVETIKPLVGANSIFLVEGETHRRERAISSPSFHGSGLEGKINEIRDVALRESDKWKPGDTIIIMDSALDVSLEVIIRVVFGVQSQERVELFKEQIKKFVSAFKPILGFTRIFHRSWLGLSPWNKFCRERESFYQMIDEEIDLRIKSGEQRTDLLSSLLHNKYDDGQAVSRERIRDQLVTMLMAGHETTQIAIAWAMSWLHRDTEILERLRVELAAEDTIDTVLKSDLLEGICNESLRLNPILADIVRVVKSDFELEEVTLPPDTPVSVGICEVHSDPELYPNPERFDPDRWINAKFKGHEYLPFGGGIRRCIGAPLAILEMKIVVATWIKHCRFQLPTDAPDVEPVYRRNLTMAPKTGIPLTLVEKLD